MTYIITNITSLTGGAAILVIKTLKADVIVFIVNFIMCLASQ